MYSVFQKGRNLLSYFSSKVKEFDRDNLLLHESILFLLTTVLDAKIYW